MYTTLTYDWTAFSFKSFCFVLIVSFLHYCEFDKFMWISLWCGYRFISGCAAMLAVMEKVESYSQTLEGESTALCHEECCVLIKSLTGVVFWCLADFYPCTYEVVPKVLLTFLGSLYRVVAKTTSRTLVYRFERQTARKKFFLQKTLCPQLRM